MISDKIEKLKTEITKIYNQQRLQVLNDGGEHGKLKEIETGVRRSFSEVENEVDISVANLKTFVSQMKSAANSKKRNIVD